MKSLLLPPAIDKAKTNLIPLGFQCFIKKARGPGIYINNHMYDITCRKNVLHAMEGLMITKFLSAKWCRNKVQTVVVEV